ncbi:hypothetical protein [Sphingomonas sp.]
MPVPPAENPVDDILCHYPDCGTWRSVLTTVRTAGIGPHIVEYRKTSPTRAG